MSLACGHPVWLALRSIESDAVLCELCEARSRARDAESEEQRLCAELADTARALGEKCSACEVGRGLEQRAEYAESRSRARYYTGDSHGGEPAEWPEDLRVRQFPEGTP